MSEIEVRIVRLEPQRVAISYGFGKNPEPIAWEQMINFIKSKGLDTTGGAHRFFGFNNPNPAPGSPNYGYEQWITIGSDVQPEGEIKVKQFEGGLYAVTRARLGSIFETWQQLGAWREKSHYKFGSHQWLEEALHNPLADPISEEMELDLYLPIEE